METGWNRSKVLILITIATGLITGVSMYVYGWYRFSNESNPNALYWIAGGFALHILFMGVIPQILKRIWNKKG